MEPVAKHILMIDNDETTRRLFGSLLGTAGYEVIYAENGIQGREMARRLHPDLILLDINMPGSDDGFRTAHMIKSDKDSASANIPIVFLSSADLPLEAEAWMKDEAFGVMDYIQKGVSNEKFIERIKEIFERIEKKPL